MNALLIAVVGFAAVYVTLARAGADLSQSEPAPYAFPKAIRVLYQWGTALDRGMI